MVWSIFASALFQSWWILGLAVALTVLLVLFLKRLGAFESIPSIQVPPPTGHFSCDKKQPVPMSCGTVEQKSEKYDPLEEFPENVIPCYDPATMQWLGTMPAMTPEEVQIA